MTTALDKRIACAIDPCHYYWTGRTEDFMPFASNGARASEIMGAVLNAQLDRLPEMMAAMRQRRIRFLRIRRTSRQSWPQTDADEQSQLRVWDPCDVHDAHSRGRVQVRRCHAERDCWQDGPPHLH